MTLPIPYIADDDVWAMLSPKHAFSAIEASLVSSWRGNGRNFPVVREKVRDDGAVFGIKSGFDQMQGYLGLKAGGYWPGNEARGLKNHQSTIILFDPETGRPRALMEANALTALRTAAAAAVSVDRLARADARVLGVIGAGRQSVHHIRAILQSRTIDRLLVWNRSPERIDALATVLGDGAPPIERLAADVVCGEAEILVTLLSAYEPVVKREWLSPGLHISAMGTDTRGKQELDRSILSEGRVFTDEIVQAATIGESQHAIAAGLLAEDAITHLGAVIVGDRPGRQSAGEITVYDGTGTALQDLAAAAAVMPGI